MVLHHLAEPQVLLGSFDAGALDRARAYALDRLVTGVEVELRDGGHLVARGEVHGSATRAYRVTVEISGLQDDAPRPAPLVDSWCTCPVTLQCKHGAALCLTLGHLARELPPEPDPDEPRAREVVPVWRRRLDAVLADLGASEPPVGEHPPLALRIGHDAGRRDRFAVGDGARVTLRPMRRGTRGWVKSGIDWQTVPSMVATRRHDPAQLEALAALQQALGGSYWYGGTEPSLADFGRRVVRLLRSARDAGIEVYADAPLSGLRLLDDPVSFAADTRLAGGGPAGPGGRRAGDAPADADLVVDLGVVVDDVVRPVSGLTLLGVPSHTVALVEDGVLTLAALEGAMPTATLRALAQDGPVVVPAEAAAELDDYLTRLRRFVPVTSSDASVAVPDRLTPRLSVAITWRDGSSADVRWGWAYGEDEARRACSVSSEESLGGVRDRAEERRVLAEHRERGPLDVEDREVGGSDAVSLALLEIPDWRSREGLEVHESHRPDFRRAESPARVTVELAGPEPSATATDGAPAATDWLDLTVVVEVQGERLPLPQVIAALTEGADYLVLPSGLYLPTDSPELTALSEAVAAAAEVHEREPGEGPGPGDLRVGRHDLDTLASLADLGDVDPSVADWVARARALRDLTGIPRPEPSGVSAELRSYQRDGFAWLAFLWEHSLGGVLADDMGLGKTLQVLALVAHTRGRGDDTPFLVVAPTSVVGAWATEAARHTPGLRVVPVTGTGTRRGGSVAELAAGADVVVTTYTLLRLEAEEYAAVAWGGVVLDEAQQVKNHRSRAHLAVKGLRAPFLLAVTGTPFENRLTELWSLLSLVAPGLYPRLASFTRSVATPVEKGDEAALARFRRRVKPFVLRRTKELVAPDLPAKQEQVLDVELAPRHRRLYDAHLARERQRILGLLEDFSENRVAILAALTRLRQLALDPALVDAEHEAVGSAKADLLLEHLGEVVAEGHRALVFSSFTGFLGRVSARLEAAGIDHAYLDGSTTDRAREVTRFRSGEVPVFAISLKAGGTGLTLTEADYVYVLDPWWNPAAEAQAVDRAHRIGQDRTVMVYRLVSTDTIEDKVMALKARKAALFAQVVDGGGASSGAITAEDVRALFE
ncbi:DEAD/DEAH box helicase [Nocardioides lentus]|uniref:DEAD/DEAH box helicase n=1 Tax=Nocardioides lentus TaxID=338077 RepID=A0ABP5B4I0_9ACTN